MMNLHQAYRIRLRIQARPVTPKLMKKWQTGFAKNKSPRHKEAQELTLIIRT
jgi:hypothetical protein